MRLKNLIRIPSISLLASAGLLASACAPGAAPSPTTPPAAATAQPPAAAGSTSSIKIGALIPLTGPNAASGQDMRDAYELARGQLNASGGIGGRPLDVTYEDDKNDNATAVASFEKMVNSDKVEVLIGGLASTVTAALIEPAKSAQVPMAWTGAASTSVEQGFQGQDWFFHYHPWEYQNAQSALAFLKSTPYKTFAVAAEDGLFGQGGAKGFQDALPQQGQQVTGTEFFKSGSGNFTAIINKLKASNPDGLLLIPFPADVVPFLTQMREVGWKPKLVYASPPGFPADFGKSPVAEGVTGLTLWSDQMASPASKKFLDDFRAKYNRDPNGYWAPLAYTNLATVAEALKKSNGGGATNKEAFVRAMEATDYDSPIGQKLTFKPSQFIKHQGFDTLVTFQWQNGKQEVIFPEALATAKQR